MSSGRAARVAAAEAHVARMKDLENVVRVRYKAGLGTQADVSAAEYYRAEAEIGLAQARGD